MSEPKAPVGGITESPAGFAQVLKAAGLAPTWDAVGGSAADLGLADATTVLAVRYDAGVYMIGDRQATEGYSVAHRRMKKVFPSDDFSAVAISGTAGLAIELVKLFQTELEHYEKLEDPAEPRRSRQLPGQAGPPAASHGLSGARCRAAVLRIRPPGRDPVACLRLTSLAGDMKRRFRSHWLRVPGGEVVLAIPLRSNHGCRGGAFRSHALARSSGRTGCVPPAGADIRGGTLPERNPDQRRRTR